MTRRGRIAARAGACVAAVTAAGGIWTVSASRLFVWAGGLGSYYPRPYTTWWLYLQQPDHDKWTKLYLAGSGVIAALPVVAVVAIAVRVLARSSKLRRPIGGGMKPLERGPTDNHGHAEWAPEKELRRRFGKEHGCLIGASDATHTPQFWMDDLKQGPLHSLVFAGPGSYKTTSAVTRIWKWRGPRVIFDPSCEIGPIMTEALERTGHLVKTIGLKEPGLNVLDWIDINDREADVHIQTAVDHIYDENAANQANEAQSKDPFWANWGKSLVTCLMAHMLYDKDPNTIRTLAKLREGLATPETEMQSLLSNINATSDSSMARDIAGGLMGMRAHETFSGIYSNSFSATRWLSVRAYADMVSGNSMKTSDILNDDMVVFVQTPLRSLLATPAIGRAVMGALFNALYHADGKVLCEQALFEIDEAWTLGKLNEIKLGYTTARKYRGVIQTLWQSEGQMEGVWGKEDAKMLRDSSSWRSYGAIQDGEVAEKISRDIGDHSVMAYSEGANIGRQMNGSLLSGSRSKGSNTNMHEIKRRLIKADEITRAPADQLFIFFRDFPYPIQAYAAPYFRYPEIDDYMNSNRFVRKAAE